jgi:hypothetical protein
LVAGTFGGACKTFKRDGEGVPPGFDAGSFEAPPSRQVVADGGLVGGPGNGGQGGGGSTEDGGAPQPRLDAAADRQPVAFVDGPPGPSFDSAREAGDTTCDLLRQGCGATMGCYPAAGGVSRCMRSEPGTPADTQCSDPTNCAAGLTCVSNNCVVLCEVAQPSCPNGGRCVPYGVYTGVGYCLP